MIVDVDTPLATGKSADRVLLARTGATPHPLVDVQASIAADHAPKYLEQVPSDPFDGRPIRYHRTEPGYRLWSVMEDGTDNGGKEKEQVGKGEPHDQCFIVTR